MYSDNYGGHCVQPRCDAEKCGPGHWHKVCSYGRVCTSKGKCVKSTYWESGDAAEYDTADAIRDRLRNEFGVSVDDRVREWVVDSAPAVAPAPVVEDEPFVVVDAPAEAPAAEAPAATEAAPAGGQSEAELSALTVPALKDLCRAAGLKVGGKKAELVERILRGSN